MMMRFEYLEVLGVPAFLYTKPVNTTMPNIEKMHVQCLVVETQNTHSFCQTGAVQELLFKMLGAIGLEKKHINYITTDATKLDSTLKQYDAKTVLLMGKGLSTHTKSHFHTHHPSEILNNAALKHEAWETLKQLEKCLK